MKIRNRRILVAVISLIVIALVTLPDASAALLADYSTTSAGGALAPTTFSTTKWSSDVHFAVYEYSTGDPIAGESGFQDFGPGNIMTWSAFYGGSSDATDSMTINAGEYLYVYQVDHDSAATENMAKLTVGIIDGAPLSSITSVGFTYDADVDIFGLGTGNMSDGPFQADFDSGRQSVVYDFAPTGYLENGKVSSTLFFTSTLAPTFNSSSLVSAGATTTMDLPSPAPEPVSSILFIAGAATLGFRRYRKNKSI